MEPGARSIFLAHFGRSLATHWGAPGTGSVSRQRWRGTCGDKGFRDAALRRGAAPEPAVLPRGRRPSPEHRSSAPVPVVIEWLPAADRALGPLRGQLPNLERG